MTLDTLEPNPAWVADAYADTVETLEANSEDVVYHVWGGDWCKDCRAQLPDFGAALDAAGVPAENVVEHPVDQDKQGEGVEEYGIELIPTVVAEYEDEEIARYVEDEGLPISIYLAEQIRKNLRE